MVASSAARAQVLRSAVNPAAAQGIVACPSDIRLPQAGGASLATARAPSTLDAGLGLALPSFVRAEFTSLLSPLRMAAFPVDPDPNAAAAGIEALYAGRTATEEPSAVLGGAFAAPAQVLKVGDKEYRVHPNVNLYVNPSPRCNARCAFCIARSDVPIDRENNGKEYLRRFEASLKFLRKQGIDHTALVLGGEPTIDRKLPMILDLLKRYKVRDPVITTNGSYLKNWVREINDSTLAHINISRHHYLDAENRSIMGSKTAPTTKDLKEVLGRIDRRISIRLNANLIKGGIDSAEGVTRFLDWAIDLGVAHIAFSQLATLPEEGGLVAKSVVKYSSAHRVSIGPILDAIRRDQRFRRIKVASGSHYNYEVWTYKTSRGEATVVFKDIDMNKIDLDSSFIDDLIFHPNATLGGSWNPKERILLP